MSELEAARRAAVQVTSLHTGGCGACAESIAALDSPRYARQMRKQGILRTALPRHSDIVLLCGALTEQARAGVSALLSGTPRPRALIAVGDCAVNGCVFAGSSQLTVPLAQAFNANVEIGGCPPAPQAILDAIVEARRLLSGAPASSSQPEAEAEAQPASSAPSGAPDRSSRLASLIEAARGSWDDDEDDDDDESASAYGDAEGHTDTHIDPDDTIASNQAMGRHTGKTSAARQQEEKRR